MSEPPEESVVDMLARHEREWDAYLVRQKTLENGAAPSSMTSASGSSPLDEVLADLRELDRRNGPL